MRLVLTTACGPSLFVCVYTPTDYFDESFMNYSATCAKITAIYRNCAATQMIVAGDFKWHCGSHFL